jgi:hypothetical protein
MTGPPVRRLRRRLGGQTRTVAELHIGAQGLSGHSRRSDDSPGQVTTCDDVLYQYTLAARGASQSNLDNFTRIVPYLVISLTF